MTNRKPVPGVTRTNSESVDRTVRVLAHLPSREQVDKFLESTHADEEATGATMDIRSHHVYVPGPKEEGGERFFSVGGAPHSETGEQIPTHLYGTNQSEPKMSQQQFLREYVRIRNRTGEQPGSAIGSFKEKAKPHLGIQMDASTVFGEEEPAQDATIKRNENSYFRGEDFSAPTNEQLRAQFPERFPGARPPKAEKQEIVITQGFKWQAL